MPVTAELILGSIHPTLPWRTKELLFFATADSVTTVLSQGVFLISAATLSKHLLQQINSQLGRPPRPWAFALRIPKG